MKEVLERVKEERDALLEKIVKLDQFLADEIDGEEQVVDKYMFAIMYTQLNFMSQYKDMLSIRISMMEDLIEREKVSDAEVVKETTEGDDA